MAWRLAIFSANWGLAQNKKESLMWAADIWKFEVCTYIGQKKKKNMDTKGRSQCLFVLATLMVSFGQNVEASEGSGKNQAKTKLQGCPNQPNTGKFILGGRGVTAAVGKVEIFYFLDPTTDIGI